MTLRAGVRRCSRKSEVEVRCATDVCVDIRKSLFFYFFLRRCFHVVVAFTSIKIVLIYNRAIRDIHQGSGSRDRISTELRPVRRRVEAAAVLRQLSPPLLCTRGVRVTRQCQPYLSPIFHTG